MRYGSIACLLSLAACSSSVETAPEPRPCVTSNGCEADERCDDGRCVPDSACPAPAAPARIHEQTEGDPSGSVVVLAGREYWEVAGSANPATEVSFIDLQTRARSTFPHPLGWGWCDGDPVTCVVQPQGGGAPTLFTGVHLDASKQTWIADASSPIPAGWSLFARDQPAAGQHLVLSEDQHTIAVWTPGGAVPEPLIDLGAFKPIVGVVEAKGLPKTVIALQNAPEGAQLAAAPLTKGATPTTFFSIPQAFKSTMLPVPTGDGGWFVVYDSPGTANGYRVWRVGANGQTEIGTSDDPLLFRVAASYRLGPAALENGSRGRAVVCSGDTCRSDWFDLATLTSQPIGSASVPDAQGLASAGTRWLACDTADVVAADLQGQALQLYRVRIAAK